MNVILDHIVLNVGDLDESVEFYQKVLGFSIERLEDYQKGAVPFPSVRINADSLIDLFPPKMWQNQDGTGNRENLNHFCLAMNFDEWNALRERLNSREIKIS